MNNLNDILKREAQSLHACHKAMRQWPENGEPQQLIELWKNNIDFALDNDFPAVDFIRDNFDRDLLNENLIFVDEYVDMDMAPSGIYILNGECSGRIRFAPWTAATVYLRHSSKVTVVASDFARLFVRLYDEADVVAESEGSAVVKVYDRRP